METHLRKTRIYTKPYEDDEEFEIRTNNRTRRPRTRKIHQKINKNFYDTRKKIRFADSVNVSAFQNGNQNHSSSTPDSTSYSGLNSKGKGDGSVVKENTLEYQRNVGSNSNVKTFNQDILNNIMSLSSVNSESHKKYELNNLKFFQNLLEDKNNFYDNDKRFVDQLPGNLIVNNYDCQFLYPWVDLIMPNYTKPYCTNLKIKSQKKTSGDGSTSKYSLGKHDNFNKKILYLSENQMFLIIDNIIEQITSTPKDVPVSIDWIKVARACNLTQEVCKEFWWSFDRTHIKDIFGGSLFTGDWNHYYKVDESYFIELKNRVRQLIKLANECKDEREKILFRFNNEIK